MISVVIALSNIFGDSDFVMVIVIINKKTFPKTWPKEKEDI